jgi:hypothetical protein
MTGLRRSPRSDEPREPFDFVGAVLSFVLGAPSCSRCPRAGRSGAPVVAAVIVFVLAAPVFPLARRATAIRSPTCACSPIRNAPWPTSPRSCSRPRGSPSSCWSRCTSRPRTGPTRSRPGCAGGDRHDARLADRRGSARLPPTGGLGLTRTGLVGLTAIPRPDLPYAPMVLMLLVIEPAPGSSSPRTPARSWRASRRGIANGIRSMLRNSGYVRERRAVPRDHHEPAGRLRQEGRLRRDAVLPSRAPAGRVHPPAAAGRCWSSVR